MPAKPSILFRNINALKPDPKNARTHSDEQILEIANSIRRFGWTSPVLADDLIRAGHGRQAAARLIYEAGERIYMAPGEANGGSIVPDKSVPVIDCSGWTEEERRAYALADNKIALNAGWDQGILAGEVGDLLASNFDVGLIGFNVGELHRLLDQGKGRTDPDEVPEAPEAPVARLGDIWLMGGHRIACGSSTDPETVQAVLAGEKPLLMVTDPPYGVEYDASFRNGILRENGTVVGARAIGKVLNDDRADWTEAWELFPGDVAYIWHAGIHAATVSDSLVRAGFEIRSQIIWAKQQFAIGRGDYHWQHEPCWYAVRKGRTGHYDGGRKQSTLWEIDKPARSETGHSTQKPIECMQRPIENNSRHDDIIYEPFSGSGTTIIAGQATGRRVFAIELNPAYVDVAVTRWEAYAEGTATLESTGQTFAEVKAARASE